MKRHLLGLCVTLVAALSTFSAPTHAQSLAKYNTATDLVAGVFAMLASGPGNQSFNPGTCHDEVTALDVQQRIDKMFNLGQIFFTRIIDQKEDQVRAVVFSAGK